MTEPTELLSSTTVLFILVEFIVGLVLQATKSLVLLGGPSLRLGQQVRRSTPTAPLLIPPLFFFSPVLPTCEAPNQLFAHPFAGADDQSAHDSLAQRFES